MKILFRQKQWIVMQVIFAISGIIWGLSDYAGISLAQHVAVGGPTVASWALVGEGDCIFYFILLSGIFFTTEYQQGTFMTSLICGSSRKRWMLRRYVDVYLFVLLQYIIAFGIVSCTAGIITHHMGFQSLLLLGQSLGQCSPATIPEWFIVSILLALVAVGMGIYFTTLTPGAPLVGTIIAIAVDRLRPFQIVSSPSHVLPVNQFLARLLLLPQLNLIWPYALLWLVVFALLAMHRVDRIDIGNAGI